MEPKSIIYQRSKAYTHAAIELLADQFPQREPERETGISEWARTSETTFELQNLELPYWRRAAWSHAETLHALTDHRLLAQALQQDPVVRRHIDTLVGTWRGARSFRIEEIADHLIWRMAEKKGGLVFDSAEFDRLFNDFDSDIRQTEIDYFAVAPIMGFQPEKVPIRLEPKLQIDRLTDEEIGRCLRVNVYPGIHSGGTLHLTYPFAVRYRFLEKKRFGDLSVDPAAIEAEQEALTSKILSVVHCLRLFKSGGVSIPSLVIFTPHWPLEGGTSGGMVEPRTVGGQYTLTSGECEAFQEFWKKYNLARRTPFIDGAIRRFGYAGERHRPEDRLVDLIVCAESLFLSDAGETRERGEMRFRLSLRFAVFADLQDYGRTDAFRLMRSAYDARSAIVHGGRISPNDLNLPKVGKATLSKFVEAVEEALRATLHQAIETQPIDKSRLVDWDALILGSSNSSN